MCVYVSVYITCILLQNNEKYVDANLEAPDNVISGNEPSSEVLSTLEILNRFRSRFTLKRLTFTGVDR